MKTPVVFLLFNRPVTTERVFATIRHAQPETLLLVADGPRPTVPADAEACAAARAIVAQIDWPCQVHRNYSDWNLGCRTRVASGLDWAFGMVEEAIVLEDDCLPHPSFFGFCKELLEHHRNDPRVMCISGSNFQNGRQRGEGSYYFSLFNHCWGWATWRRAWSLFDVDVTSWPDLRESRLLESLFDNRRDVEYWARRFERAHSGRADTWDFQWTLACWAHRGLTCTPNANLVENLGYGPDATHTTEGTSPTTPAMPIDTPLRHPPSVVRDEKADDYAMRHRFHVTKSMFSRLLHALQVG